MASSARRRRKRRSEEYRPPTTRRAARESAARTDDAGAPKRPPRAGRHPNRPPSPWGSFPLVELVILLSLVLLMAGFFAGGTRGVVMIAAGISLGSLAALELTLREHFTGYRSHSSVLAGFLTVIVLGVGFFFAWPQAVKLGAGVATFALGFYVFREAFKRRSGGLGFR